MKSMTSRILALATMSLVGTGLVGAQAVQANMEWTYEGWSPTTYTTKDLSVVANVGSAVNRFNFQREVLNYRMVSETKEFGTYELGFRASYIAKAEVTAKTTSLVAYGVWYSVNEIRDYTERWKGYAVLNADSQGFELQGVAPRGYQYLVDSGLWGKHEEVKGDYGWRSFGRFVVQQQQIK